MMKSLLTLLLVATGTLHADALPNIVLVMADDQGWGDMAYNGHADLKTPNFDNFAKEGIRFDNFHAAAPVCSPTRGSVMTGRTPNRYGTFQPGSCIRPQEVTIAEALKTAGYRTGHFGKWHLGSVQKASPVCPGACGFDEWISAPNFFDLNPILSDQGKAVEFKGDSSDVTADVAINFIRKCTEEKQRFLTVVWFGSPHDPHQPLPQDKAIYAGLPEAQANFYGEITAMDRAFGRLRREIKTLGLRENTLLWFNSDNGALPKVGSTGPNRRGHKGEVYEGGLLVPCIIEWPSRFEGNRVVTTPCVTSDIYPTVLDIVDVTMPHQPQLDGISLVPLLDGKETKRPKPIGFWNLRRDFVKTPAAQWMKELLQDQRQGIEPNDPQRIRPDAAEIKNPMPTDKFPGHAAWLDGDWKLHRIQNEKTGDITWEIYDLKTDPDENSNLIAEQPERLAHMRGELNDWLESVVSSYNGEDYPK
jgi:arylsulfatase A-like enzyme